jgi:hypothetical protein
MSMLMKILAFVAVLAFVAASTVLALEVLASHM